MPRTSAPHPKVIKGADYTVSELANCSGACHVYSSASATTVARAGRGYHRVTDATFKLSVVCSTNSAPASPPWWRPGAQAQMVPLTPLRLMNVIDVSEHEDQVDLAILFNCSMRFVSAIPVSEGQVHLQLAPLADCGVTPLTQISPEIPPVSRGCRGHRVRRAPSPSPPGRLPSPSTSRRAGGAS